MYIRHTDQTRQSVSAPTIRILYGDALYLGNIAKRNATRSALDNVFNALMAQSRYSMKMVASNTVVVGAKILLLLIRVAITVVDVILTKHGQIMEHLKQSHNVWTPVMMRIAWE